ncbi:hypothetical protein AB0F17_59625 [Nonomuraea sp. NPDC026600]|uniref:hypothetical protein n=1 Tax=Nonomuraea sp. NPDC026600 TaxID=3155363 RepID=UPI003407FF65
MTTTLKSFPGAPAHLQRELDGVRAELVRLDAKSTGLIGLTGTMIAILVAGAGIARLPLLALGAIIAAAVLLAAALAVLLAGVIMPALAPHRDRGRTDVEAGYGFVAYAAAGSVEALIDALAVNQNGLTLRLGNELLQRSRLTDRKNRRLQLAVLLLLGALVAMVAALVLMLVGRVA